MYKRQAQNCGKRPPFILAEDESALAKLVSDLYRDLCGEYPTQSVVKELRKSIAYAKNMMLPEERLGELDTGFEKFPELYREYGKALRDNKWMDYDDQMVYAKKILEFHEDVRTHFQNRFPYICVDESQDTSRIQHAIIRLLAGKSGNIFMVGDEDQSIYGFRAAYPDALMQFEQTYPGARVLLMEENYRSTPEILRAADAFIRKNHHRRPKTIHPTRASGAAVRVIYAMDRADQYPWLVNMAASVREETAVLYRNNDSALPLIDLLDRGGIPYRCRRMSATIRWVKKASSIRDIIALAHDQTDAETFLRIYYKVGGGISKKAAEYACQKSRANGGSILRELLGFPQLSQYGRDSAAALLTMLPMLLQDNAAQGLSRIWDGLRYRDYAERQKLDGGKYEILCLLARQETGLEGLCRRLDELQALVSAPSLPCGGGLILSTVHSSKGLEYDTVYLLDVLDGILPAVTEPKDAGQQDQYQEERRLFYVAVTRARNRLYLFACRNRESAFADELRRELAGKLSAFTGNSGVGKSSVLNRLLPELHLPVGEVSKALGRGRHTTRHVELFALGGGTYVIDTPGFSSFDTEEMDLELKAHLPETFPEFAPYVDQCRFTGCTHTKEKGCRVLQAVQDGDIPASRHRSYLRLYDELKDLRAWQKK